MKVLQICNKPPLPDIDGGCMAMNSLGLGLMQNGVDLDVLCIETPKHLVKKEFLSEEYMNQTNLKSVFINTNIKVSRAFFSILKNESYNVSRFVSDELKSKLKEILINNNYDAVILESIYVAPYIKTIRHYSKAKIILRTHNVEYLIWQQMQNNSRNILKKIYLNYLSKRLKVYEEKVWGEVDGIATISFKDKELIEKKVQTNLLNIPFGIDLKKYNYSFVHSHTTFHLGSLDWKPNIEGVEWFIKKVVPKIYHNEFKFKIAGRHIPSWLMGHSDKIKVIGDVDSSKDFISNNGIMVVPLLSGSGMRIKIIQGMALGKVIVTTSVGIEGIPAIHNKDVVIADSPNDFAREIDLLLSDKVKRERLSKNARVLVENEFSNQKISNTLIGFLKDV